MSNPEAEKAYPIALSIGILAWNEESSIAGMLASLLQQSIYARLAARGLGCEIVCLANGCTDGTVRIAAEIFGEIDPADPIHRGLSARVADIPQPGRNNAWNRFVHEFSAPEARYVCLMDADIIFERPDTLELVVAELERDGRLGGASDWPVKTLADPAHPTWRERLSLATSDMTGTIAGRLNGMLYILRADVARRLYLPRDLVANDDGFFKAAICTDFFRAPLDPRRVVSVRAATHFYEPYLALRDVVNNQKRQMIGQTAVHVLVEHVRTLPEAERADLNATFRGLEARDPDWLKRLIDAHVARTRFRPWLLFPDLLSYRWRRLARMRGLRRLTHFPATLAGFLLTCVAGWKARRFLAGGVSTYWPKTARSTPLLSAPVPESK